MSLYAFSRFVFGGRVHVTIVIDGHLTNPTSEDPKYQSHFLWLDASSAAVIKSADGRSRVVGTVFTCLAHDEIVLCCYSTKPQLLSLGPHLLENPYPGRQNWETRESYKARKERTAQTIALTKDGSEISATIHIQYKIDATQSSLLQAPSISEAEKNSSSSKFFFHLRSHGDWQEMAAGPIVHVWKEVAGQFTSLEFRALVKNGETLLERINVYIHRRLTKPRFPAPIDRPEIVAPSRMSPEFFQLKSSGIQILSVTILQCRMPDIIEEQILHDQTLKDQVAARGIAHNIFRHTNKLQKEAELLADIDFALALSRFPASKEFRLHATQSEKISSVIKGVLHLIRHNPLLTDSLEKEYQLLTNLSDSFVDIKRGVQDV